MAMLLGMLALPLAYFAALVALARRNQGRIVAVSVAFFLAAVAAGFWTITRSRSSTAGIGIIFLPLLGVLAGLLGLGFARWRTAADALSRMAGWLCLVCAIALLSAQVLEGRKSIERNALRDAQYAAQQQRVVEERAAITTTLASNAGRESETLDAQIRARTRDRAFLLAALERPVVSPDLLDSLARSPDLGIALLAVRNPNTRPETLERVYREHTNPEYFFHALAAHPHTPPIVARAIHENPRAMGGLDIWFAKNPATPRDVLDRIARTTTSVHVVRELLGNPALDCGLLTQTAGTVEKAGMAGQFTDVVPRIAELRPALCR